MRRIVPSNFSMTLSIFNTSYFIFSISACADDSILIAKDKKSKFKPIA